MVPNGEGDAHQLPTTARGGEMLCQRAKQSVYPTENGQHHGHLVHKQTRGHSLPSTERANKESVAMVYEQEHHAKRCPPGRETQCSCRRGVQVNEGQN